MDSQKEKGQVILILLLVMSVALGVGLSIVQRSLSDVSTATKVEQSQRAFSAAEAGIERALWGGTTNFQLENSTVSVDVRPNLPNPGQALEYPPLSKEEIAHVWLVSPNDLTSEVYNGSSLDIYWGDQAVSGSDTAAIEITFVYLDSSGAYRPKKFFYDPDTARRSNNGFQDPGNCAHSPISTSLNSTAKSFKCKVNIAINSANFPSLSRLMLLRARLLYTSISQSFATAPITGSSLPRQAQLLLSTGSSGQSQRKVRLFQVVKTVPFYFDYAIFSAAEISK